MAENQWDIIAAQYVASAVKAAQYPEAEWQEIAFLGRSNVGKSSLLNSLTRRKGLARVSSSPGKTQTINFYECKAKNGEMRKTFFAVDLPGYGFAKTAKTNREQWSDFICKYLEHSERLQLICQLIDIRHKPLAIDLECYAWLSTIGVPLLVVLTKADKLSRGAAAGQVEVFKKALGVDGEHILSYSSTLHTQREAMIQKMLAHIE